MPEPRPSRSSRPGSPPAKRTGTGYGKTSDQGRGAAKRNQDSPSARAFRNKEATGSSSGRQSTRGMPAGRDRAQQRDEREAPMAPARKGWGSLTRKGAASMKEGPRAAGTREIERTERPRADREDKNWLPQEKKRAPKAERTERPKFIIPDDAVKEIHVRAGKRSERLLKYLKEAGTAYASERWSDAKKALRPLLQEVPDAPVVQELYGMVLYRQGKWQQAVKELELAHVATRSYDPYPAIMDCYRALHKWKKVDSLWDELRAESPGAEVTAEGRIVASGALADQNRIQDAIRNMEKGPRPKSNPKEHHLRSWYVLADLYDRAGESSKARSLFQKVAKHDPELADVLERLDALG